MFNCVTNTKNTILKTYRKCVRKSTELCQFNLTNLTIEGEGESNNYGLDISCNDSFGSAELTNNFMEMDGMHKKCILVLLSMSIIEHFILLIILCCCTTEIKKFFLKLCNKRFITTKNFFLTLFSLNSLN
ncbi:hypothetical protein Mgra_00004596 [Meloidogyne graminicola]|uniref:Uncharacterized protein n=1 Tax=Meloidogyne graminicola TaxID=189291 RepID=A0A8S9ZRC4_9BILA|nr:hypothetical protein Mgra_00004596 [Meloidogyne graminicola]